MNWKVRFQELTGLRPKNDEERSRTVENLREIAHGNVTEAPRLGFSSRKQFFSLISSDSRITKRAEHFLPSLLPLFIGKWGRSLPPSSPIASFRSNRLLEEFSGRPKWVWLVFAPPFLLNTLPFSFLVIFFRNVTKLYEFRNDACFLSVMLRNLTDYVIIPFFPSGMLQNFTDYALTLPFNLRHVTKFHGLCDNAFSWLPTCHGTSRIA